MSNIDHAFDDETDAEPKPKPTIARFEIPFPLRPDFIVRLSLPGDLTLDEAWRIAMMLKTIPAPEGERAEQMELTK